MFGLVQNVPVEATTTNPTATYGVTPTAGNLLVCLIGLNESTPANLTNPAGWSQRGEKSTGAATGLVRVLSRISNGTEGAVAFTDPFTRTYDIELTEWSGNAPAGSEFDAVSAGATGGTTSIQPGSLTPARTAGLIVMMVHHAAANGGSEAIDSGFTLLDAATFTLGLAAYKIKTDAAAENPTASWLTNTGGNVAISAAFLTTSVAATPKKMMMVQAVRRAAVR